MKKLMKKSLDELAQTMPVLSEKNQHECVGGFTYFNIAGDFLGENSWTSETYYETDMCMILTGNDITGIERAISSGTLSSFAPSNELHISSLSDSDKSTFVIQRSRDIRDYDASGVSFIANTSSPTLSVDGTELIVNETNLPNYRWSTLESAFLALDLSGSGSGAV